MKMWCRIVLRRNCATILMCSLLFSIFQRNWWNSGRLRGTVCPLEFTIWKYFYYCWNPASSWISLLETNPPVCLICREKIIGENLHGASATELWSWRCSSYFKIRGREAQFFFATGPPKSPLFQAQRKLKYGKPRASELLQKCTCFSFRSIRDSAAGFWSGIFDRNASYIYSLVSFDLDYMYIA